MIGFERQKWRHKENDPVLYESRKGRGECLSTARWSKQDRIAAVDSYFTHFQSEFMGVVSCLGFARGLHTRSEVVGSSGKPWGS